MDIPVLTAVTGARWEADLIAAFERGVAGVHVVRRCVDLADLLAAAASGTARAALVRPDLRRLDRAAVSRLGADGLAVVGVVDPDDEPGERWLRQLGVRFVVPADAGPERIAAAVAAAVASAGPGGGPADLRPAGDLPVPAEPGPTGPEPGDEIGEGGRPGRLVAVWGPTGAPGRTTVAVTLADEIAASGVSVLLADADSYGGAVAQMLGLLDEAPGLAAAARAANVGSLDVPALAAHARSVPGPARLDQKLRVLTGITRADRWPELRPASLEVVWDLARRLATVTVVDCGFCLEQDEGLSFDTVAPQRNGATLATLARAEVVLAVGAADPLGLHRLVRGLAELREAVPHATVRVVLTRVRRDASGPDPERRVTESLVRFAGLAPDLLVPADAPACDRAMLAGRTLREVAPDSPARRAMAGFAADLVRGLEPARAGFVPAAAVPAGRRGLLRRR